MSEHKAKERMAAEGAAKNNAPPEPAPGARVTSGILTDEEDAGPDHPGQHVGFQSREAARASVPRRVTYEEDDNPNPPSAEVANYEETHRAPRRPAPQEDPMRQVRVRSREYIPPFFYGKRQYSLPAGKDVVVPLAVKRHLEEKKLL